MLGKNRRIQDAYIISEVVIVVAAAVAERRLSSTDRRREVVKKFDVEEPTLRSRVVRRSSKRKFCCVCLEILIDAK